MNTGSRLGPYEILSPIGAGGMGEVYKARDTRLDRSVAIKILPGEFASDAQLKLRFEREAKTISQLTHPNICTLYDVGSEGGVEYLVMELLDGESLAERVARGPLPIEQVLRIGIAMAEALERAHRAGVVHRDLKPGNVMLTKGGAKLLDFGLAKPSASLATISTVAGTVLPTEQKPLTQEGTIIGTFQYMAPEQIEGRDADHRTDIFALGALLYEMATGKRAFESKSRASLIASILDREPPPISTVQPVTPRSFERVVGMCMKKDPDERWQSAHDVAAELRWIVDGSEEARPAARMTGTSRVAWPLAALLAIALTALGTMYVKQRNAPKAQVRFGVMPPPNTSWTSFNSLSISPDGKRLVFFAAGDDPRGLLFVRNLDSLATQPLPGTEDASFPFWSPDSRSVAFFTSGKLKKVSLGGGPPVTVCDAKDGRGGTWNEDGVIIFAPSPHEALARVSAAGGVAAPLLKLDEATHEQRQLWPAFLPDGRHFLYQSERSSSDAVVVAALDGSEKPRVIAEAEAAIFAPPQYLLLLRKGTALVQKFDMRKLQLAGEPLPVAEDLGYSAATGYAAFACSREGTLMYRAGGAPPTNQFVWMNRDGKQLGKVIEGANVLGEPALSPDGKRLAYAALDVATKRSDLWVTDLARGATTRLTFDGPPNRRPVWSPDGTRILYSVWPEHGEDGTIVQRLASGVGAPAVVAKGKGIFATDWSPDGRFVLLDIVSARRDIVALELATGKRIPLVVSAAGEWGAHFSPDGRWFAYASNDSGRPEVFVQAFPPNGGKWQISTAGGVQPWWSRGGKEIDYLDFAGHLVSVSVSTEGGTITAGVPAPLFSNVFPGNVDDFDHYTPAADGERFIFDPPTKHAESAPITVVLNWTSELPR